MKTKATRTVITTNMTRNTHEAYHCIYRSWFVPIICCR